RKSHIKSRKGCANCKRRRIKCDEEKPQCFNCLKHGVEFVDGKYIVEQDAGDLGVPMSIPDQKPLPPHLPPLHMEQLEFFHHFLTVTSPTLSDVTDGDLWLTQIPRLAFRYDYLMYAILTIATTHIRFQIQHRVLKSPSISPDDRDRELYFERAEIWYRQKALETFRQAISAPRTAYSLQAMTVTGSLLAIQSFAYRDKAEGDGSTGDNVAEGEFVSAMGSRSIQDPAATTIVSIDRWLPLLLGLRTVVHEMQYTNVQTSGIDLRSIFGIDFSSLQASADGPPTLQYLVYLTTSEFAEMPSEIEIYMPPIHCLSQLVEAFRHSRRAELRKYVFTWPFLCSEEFLTRLRGRNPIALIVFVHFLTVTSLLGAWWQEDRVRADVRAICNIYLKDPKWMPWLEWAIKVLPFNVF
ncbi:hypothetical protein V1511DRAFT_451294, partial [Dipodascopsis uninucleata]